jgi:hypothetical protein
MKKLTIFRHQVGEKIHKNKILRCEMWGLPNHVQFYGSTTIFI